ncbi:D-serine ammonia-lyase [Shouchella patagoniensis]|uniref:D-serine ammonia-lyase n=1 Tax=Shouchella patagoniensis TaxID=228576 RepID=UPI0009950333|nr:D-serine ammonia-lyase [Shouchella patagoniensis]
MVQTIAGKQVAEWVKALPLLDEVIATREVYWNNPNQLPVDEMGKNAKLTMSDVMQAEQRLRRFAPYLTVAFPETKITDGIIESALKKIPAMKKQLEQRFKVNIPGDLWLKCDNDLPISGSIKARGGIYEVLKHAESLLFENQFLQETDDYSIIAEPKFKSFFSSYSIVVGSTGNLGLSIGIMSAKLGFQATVHMSADAKQWKKEMLRDQGVNVVEHVADYSKAVEEGRAQAGADPNSYFIDDEHSEDLFLGYAVAALRLKEQLNKKEIRINKANPLHVYLPCGVGGGPGGVAFGLKLVFGENVHCYFAEPTHSPCMLLGMITGEHNNVSVQDFGIDNKTAADGLAVGRASGFVGRLMEPLLSGIYTVEDAILYELLADIADLEGIQLEPSALASLYGPVQAARVRDVTKHQGTHIAWATGGSMVPQDTMLMDYQKGKKQQVLSIRKDARSAD